MYFLTDSNKICHGAGYLIDSVGTEQNRIKGISLSY